MPIDTISEFRNPRGLTGRTTTALRCTTMGLEVTGRDVNASAGDGMGILPSNMFDAPPKAEALDPRAIAIAQLSELLEWERKARVEAQNRVLELDAELHRVRLDAIAERERLKLELAAAEAANGDGNDAEIALQDATQRFHDELSALKKQLRELEREKAASAQAHGAASGELESHKRAAARAMAEAHELRRRTGQTARRAAVQLRGIKEQWTTCQLALTEQAIETRTIFDDARAAFAKAAACVIQREADEKRALSEQAAEAGKLAEALAAARAEAKRLGEELKSTAPALAEAQSALKRERANLKRLQELCDRLKDERADAAALEKARDEALANAFAAAVLEKKLRNELEGERAKTQAQAARVLAAESAAAEARAQSQRFEGQVMELTAAIEALQRQLNQRGPRVSGASLRQLEAAARELYISGGRHIEGFLSALAKLEVHHAYEDGESEEGSTKPSRKPSSDEVVGFVVGDEATGVVVGAASPAAPASSSGGSGGGEPPTGHADSFSGSHGGSRSGGSRGSSIGADAALALTVQLPAAPLQPLASKATVPSPWADSSFGVGKGRSGHGLLTMTKVANGAGTRGRPSVERMPHPAEGTPPPLLLQVADGRTGPLLAASSSVPNCPPVVRGGAVHASAPGVVLTGLRAGGMQGAPTRHGQGSWDHRAQFGGERMRMAP